VIPHDYVTEWRAHAPWIEDFQVEQDLVISRALVEIFSNPVLSSALAFRGGTALYKLHLRPPARYSEDIDLVQVRPEAAGPMSSSPRSECNWPGRSPPERVSTSCDAITCDGENPLHVIHLQAGPV
jgi:hypothetical protein